MKLHPLIEALLGDSTITQIVLNGPHEIFYEQRGRLERSNQDFPSPDAYELAVEALLNACSRDGDGYELTFPRENVPTIFSIFLSKGSQPQSPSLLVIRLAPRTSLSLESFQEFHTLTSRVSQILQLTQKHAVSVCVSSNLGGGGSVLFKALMDLKAGHQRVGYFGPPRQLNHESRHLIQFRYHESTSRTEAQKLFRQIPKLVFDELAVENLNYGAYELLRNLGGLPMLLKLTAPHVPAAVSLLRVLAKEDRPELPWECIDHQIGALGGLFVHMNRLPDGARKVTQIYELCGIENGKPILHEIGSWHAEGVSRTDRIRGAFRFTGYYPQAFASRGLGADLFFAGE